MALVCLTTGCCRHLVMKELVARRYSLSLFPHISSVSLLPLSLCLSYSAFEVDENNHFIKYHTLISLQTIGTHFLLAGDWVL